MRAWPRLQIHLSTAVLMMFAAAGFIWMNTAGRKMDLSEQKVIELEDLDKERLLKALLLYRFQRLDSKDIDPSSKPQLEHTALAYGWPIPAARKFTFAYIEKGDVRHAVDSWYSVSSFHSAAIDASVAIVVLIGVGCLGEWQIRLRTRSPLKPRTREI